MAGEGGDLVLASGDEFRHNYEEYVARVESWAMDGWRSGHNEGVRGFIGLHDNLFFRDLATGEAFEATQVLHLFDPPS